jgi:hypothetical protein
MHSSDDTFYARIPTLSDAELYNYIHHYSHYKIEAVHAAIAELRARGLHVSHDALVEIEQYGTQHDPQRRRLCTCDPRWLRWLAYVIFTLGIFSAVYLYVTASPPPHHPLGYDPFASKKYVHELELYGGKITILAVEFRQWFERLWQGQYLSYTIACITVMLASLLWFLGSHATSNLDDTHAENHHAPSDEWS